jgi:hypothetical protein
MMHVAIFISRVEDASTLLHIRKEGMSSPMSLNMKDEAMIAWKGWLTFEVNIPNKPNK